MEHSRYCAALVADCDGVLCDLAAGVPEPGGEPAEREAGHQHHVREGVQAGEEPRGQVSRSSASPHGLELFFVRSFDYFFGADASWVWCGCRERDLRRAKAAEAEAKSREGSDHKDGKDDKMEELLRKVRQHTQSPHMPMAHAPSRGSPAIGATMWLLDLVLSVLCVFRWTPTSWP